jgi:small GTP-binding protein
MKQVKELRIGVLGSVDSGKSTLTGVLTTNSLDNGRGIIRDKVLKHPHEKESGRTSDISQKYIRINSEELEKLEVLEELEVLERTEGLKDKVNDYEKLIGFVDLAGHEKYLRTTINGVNRCSIDYAIIVIGANMGILRMTQEHLTLCLSLNIPTIIVITKIDIAPDNVYERTKKDLLTLIKKKTKDSRYPYFINSKTSFNEVISKYYDSKEYVKVLPIFSVSNVSGLNISLLLNSIKRLPIYKDYEYLKTLDANFIIENNYVVKGIGLVVSGVVNSGIIKKNDSLFIGPFDKEFYNIQIKTIHNNFKEFVDKLEAGQGGCFNIKINSKIPIKRNNIRKGIRILKNPNSYKKFIAEVKIMHHPTTIKVGYEPTIHTGCVCQTAKILKINGTDVLRLGEKAEVEFEFSYRPEYIQPRNMLVFREGRTKGIGRILEVY